MAAYAWDYISVGINPVGFSKAKMEADGTHFINGAFLMIYGGDICFTTLLNVIPSPPRGFIVPKDNAITLYNGEHDIRNFRAVCLDETKPATIFVQFFDRL